MEKIFCCFLLCSAVFCGGADTPVAHSVKFVSHQGERFDAPIHSAPAYRLAMERKADLMKLDVHYTRDAVPVLSHDSTLQRTMGWNVWIRRKTLKELKEKGRFLPVGGYKGEKIMTLAEGLAIVKDCPQFWLDTKTFPIAPEFGWKKGSCLEVALKEFEKAGIDRSRVILATFNEKALLYAQKHHPDLRRIKHIDIRRKADGIIYINFAPFKIKTTEKLAEYLLKEKERLGLWGMNLMRNAFAENLLTPEIMNKLQQAGLWCSIWFVNNPIDATYFSMYGADAFVTDKIEMVRPFCRQREKSRK